MSDVALEHRGDARVKARAKFADPDMTANGQPRARVALEALETLWFNTGTLCNIECANCYIASSPVNDRLVYMTAGEVGVFLDEISALGLATREIGFTGGEPFMNQDMPDMAGDALARGFNVLILTNAMAPMQRRRVKAGLLELVRDHREKLTLRVSLDHYSQELHEKERGAGTWARTLEGLDWLSANGFQIAIAGRTCWGEDEGKARDGYAALIAKHGWRVDARDPMALALFPEMDEAADVPEISAACWGILGVTPSDIMCATSRMVVKRKGDARPTVLPCTLLPYDGAFDMGASLSAAAKTEGHMFAGGAVKLCHPHCAKFCVLGGGSCSG
ncbi:antilisterial bacteriocin subtilosin biosynthesis protein AlbA [bacterium BMS3Bbin10]|nr:antilisterial bacteriocin subtilosin biosynthesis protein AlbA [bacterium BMS3Bbin10]